MSANSSTTTIAAVLIAAMGAQPLLFLDPHHLPISGPGPHIDVEIPPPLPLMTTSVVTSGAATGAFYDANLYLR